MNKFKRSERLLDIDSELSQLFTEMKELDALYISKQKQVRDLKKEKESLLVEGKQSADNWQATRSNVAANIRY